MSNPSWAERTLQTLRYGPDQIIINPEGEQVWLAGITWGDHVCQRGLTDCCLADSPCNYHAAIYEGRCPCPWVPALQWTRDRGDRPTFLPHGADECGCV